MPAPLRFLALLTLPLGLGGCLSTHESYLVTGDPVNPSPVEVYRVECTSAPNGLNFLAGGYGTNCRQVQEPAATIRARG